MNIGKVLRGIQAVLIGTFAVLGLAAMVVALQSDEVVENAAVMTLCSLIVAFIASIRTLKCNLDTMGKVLGVALAVVSTVLLLDAQAAEESTKVETVGALGVLAVLALPTGAVAALVGYWLCRICCWLVGKVRGQVSSTP